MQYKISNLQIVSEDGVAVNQILTLEATYDSGETSNHGKVISLDSDVQAEAVTFAAELEQVLQEPKVITTEDVLLTDKESAVATEDVLAAVQASLTPAEVIL